MTDDTKVKGKAIRLSGGRMVFLGGAGADGGRPMRFSTEGHEPQWIKLSQEALDALCDLNGRPAATHDVAPVVDLVLDCPGGARRVLKWRLAVK